MRVNLNYFFCSFLVGMFFSTDAGAESVREAMVEAWRSNPQLLAAREGYFSATTDVQSAFSQWLPQASLQLEYGINQSRNKFTIPPQNMPSQNQSGTITDTLNPWSANLQVTQNIFRGGQIIAELSQAQYNREAVFGDLLSVEQSVLLTTAMAYFDLLRDEAIVGLNRNNVSILQKRLTETRNRFRVGEGTRTLVAFAEARLSAAQTQLASAEAQFVAARAAYERVIGRKPVGKLGFSEPPALPKSKAQIEELARQNHPALLATRQRYNIAESARVAAYGLFLPIISVEGLYSQGEELSSQSKSTTNLSVKGRVTMPLFRGGSSFATVRKASHEAERVRFSLLDQTRQVNELVANGWQRLLTARAQITSTSQQVRASRIALNGIRQQQLVGTSTFLDSLDAEQDYLDAQVSLAAARRDEQVAIYNLLSAAGLLTAERLGLDKEKP